MRLFSSALLLVLAAIMTSDDSSLDGANSGAPKAQGDSYSSATSATKDKEAKSRWDGVSPRFLLSTSPISVICPAVDDGGGDAKTSPASTDASDYTLQELQAMSKPQINTLCFSSCDDATLLALFPPHHTTSNAAPPQSHRASARLIRDWRRLGAAQQATLIEKENSEAAARVQLMPPPPARPTTARRSLRNNNNNNTKRDASALSSSPPPSAPQRPSSPDSNTQSKRGNGTEQNSNGTVQNWNEATARSSGTRANSFNVTAKNNTAGAVIRANELTLPLVKHQK